MHAKRAIKGGAGLASVAAAPLVRQTGGAGCILAYHRVANLDFIDPRFDDWNVPPAAFEAQLAALKKCAAIVPLDSLLQHCDEDRSPERPAVALTFDDGYANFHSEVLPILKRHAVPATVFVVTSMVGSKDPPPFDAWSVHNCARSHSDAWRLLGWDELEQCLDSGLVQVGAHSHRHLKAPLCSGDDFAEEAGLSRSILISRHGAASAYAYPYGATRQGFVPDAYVRAVQAAGYRRAVTFDLGRVRPGSDPYRLPRVEAHGLDGPRIIRAKVMGSLAPFWLTDRLRRTTRAA